MQCENASCIKSMLLQACLRGGHSRPHLSPFVPVPFGILHVKGREIGDEWGQMGTIRDKWGHVGTKF